MSAQTFYTMKKFNDAKNGVLPFVKENNLAPVILGVLIVIAGFAVFNIFDKFAPGEVNTEEEKMEEANSNNSDVNIIEDTKLVANKDENTKAESNDSMSEGIVTTDTKWVANNYKEGDITGDKYTVVRGDTLWEISEASYGTGAEWHKIADANNVSYLANGNPLIVPGQELTIPQE